MIVQIAVIKSKENILSADELIAEVNNQAIPILWISSEGRFFLVPKEIVDNLLGLHEGLQQTQDPEYKSPPLQIVRDQGIEIDNAIGKILAGE